MFRIQNLGDLSTKDLALRHASDERLLAGLAASLERLTARCKHRQVAKLPRVARFLCEPVGKVVRLHKARRAGVSRSCRVAVLDPENMVHFGRTKA